MLELVEELVFAILSMAGLPSREGNMANLFGVTRTDVPIGDFIRRPQ